MQRGSLERRRGQEKKRVRRERKRGSPERWEASEVGRLVGCFVKGALESLRGVEEEPSAGHIKRGQAVGVARLGARPRSHQDRHHLCQPPTTKPRGRTNQIGHLESS